MDLIAVVIALIVVGLLLYLVDQFLPIDANIKSIIKVVVIIFVVLWLLGILTGYMPPLRVGK